MASVRIDDEDYFTDQLQAWAVPDTVKNRLARGGFKTISLLAHAIPSLEHLEPFLVSVLGRPAGSDPAAPLFTPEAASLRRVVKECISQVSPAGSSAIATPSPGTAVPKKSLDAADINKLVQDFQGKYPSELLRPDIMPSRAFLSAVKDAVSSDHMRWFSWRVRTSEADGVAFTERRRPRTDSQMLASLLAPSAEEEFLIDIPMQAPMESVVRKFFDRLCIALAMLDACHLLPLRKLMEKFVGLATMVPIDRTLRGPTLPRSWKRIAPCGWRSGLCNETTNGL